LVGWGGKWDAECVVEILLLGDFHFVGGALELYSRKTACAERVVLISLLEDYPFVEGGLRLYQRKTVCGETGI
jgi:hypothetical protein